MSPCLVNTPDDGAHTRRVRSGATAEQQLLRQINRNSNLREIFTKSFVIKIIRNSTSGPDIILLGLHLLRFCFSFRGKYVRPVGTKISVLIFEVISTLIQRVCFHCS